MRRISDKLVHIGGYKLHAVNGSTFGEIVTTSKGIKIQKKYLTILKKDGTENKGLYFFIFHGRKEIIEKEELFGLKKQNVEFTSSMSNQVIISL